MRGFRMLATVPFENWPDNMGVPSMDRPDAKCPWPGTDMTVIAAKKATIPIMVYLLLRILPYPIFKD